MSSLLTACAIIAVASAPVAADPIAMRERPGHVTEAVIEVDAPPAQIYALVTDYAKWPEQLSDVTTVDVQRGGREDARVRFKSKVFGRSVTVQFNNQRDHVIHFTGVEGPPGGRAGGTYVLEPLDGGKRTRVIASLYLDVVGPPSLFVRDSTIRSMRQNKLRADITDMLHRVGQGARQ